MCSDKTSDLHRSSIVPINPSGSSPYIPSGMPYAVPRRGLALTFGTLLSSQGAGAHRCRPCGPTSGQLAQHMGGSRACQPAGSWSVRTRSAAPGAPCRREDRHLSDCSWALCCSEPQSAGQPFEVSRRSVARPEARAEARQRSSGGCADRSRRHRHPRALPASRRPALRCEQKVTCWLRTASTRAAVPGITPAVGLSGDILL